MTRLVAQFSLAAAFWISIPVAAPAQTAAGNEISEVVIYHEGRHVFLASRNAKLNGQPAGSWKLAGGPIDRIGTRGSDAIAGNSDSHFGRATDGPAGIAASKDKTAPSQIDTAPDRTPLGYLALGLLFFIAVWTIAYRPERSQDADAASMKDRAEALDARLTYMDQRLADIERRIRKQSHHAKAA